MGSFSLDVSKFAEKAKMSTAKAIRGTSIKLFSAIITSSPVDTGRFRANWMISGRQPDTSTTQETDKSGGKTVDSATNFILSAGDYGMFTLSNNLPYAHVIEYGGYPGDGPNTVGGFSKQAPNGMVRTNIARFDQLLNEAAQEAKK